MALSLTVDISALSAGHAVILTHRRDCAFFGSPVVGVAQALGGVAPALRLLGSRGAKGIMAAFKKSWPPAGFFGADRQQSSEISERDVRLLGFLHKI